MTKQARRDEQKAKIEGKLDEALADSFPASDQPAMTEPSTKAELPRKRSARRPTGKQR
jgi:hypothetical protein